MSPKRSATDTKPALLIVDDNEAIRKLLVLALREVRELEIEAVGTVLVGTDHTRSGVVERLELGGMEGVVLR